MTADEWTMRDRVRAVMAGETPDRLPFIDRMEIWVRQASLVLLVRCESSPGKV